MKFGENLQKLRKEKGISQEQLAEQLGVTRQSVSKWESGNSYPEMDKLIAICNIFHCELDALINKDITEEREKKDASSVVKNIFQSITSYIKKTIYVLEHKSIKELIKMLAQIFIIVCVILICSIPFMLLKDIVISLFNTGDNVFTMFFTNFWEFIFNGLYVIFAIASFLYIFKLKFLDEEEIIVEEVIEEVKEEKTENNPAKESKEKVKIITRKTNDFSLLDLLVKCITITLKGIFLLFLIPIGIMTITTVIGLVLLLVVIAKGLFLVGPILLTLAIVVFEIVVIELILDFVFNLKFSKRRIIITIISSLVVGSIGLALSIWYFLNINIVNEVPNDYSTEEKEEVFNMNDELRIHYYDLGATKYIVDNTMQDKVRIQISYYEATNDVDVVQDGNDIYLDYQVVDKVNIKQITDNIIDDLKNNTLHTYDKLNRVSMTITSSKENIEKLQSKMTNY